MLNHTLKSALFFCLLLVLLANDGFSQLITQPQARRIGLTRKWTAQATMSSSQSTLKQLLLSHGTLFSLTDTGQLQAFDAETGATKWTVQVGRRDLVVSEMSASKNYVSVMNGSSIYVYNRYNGKLLWSGEADVIPGAGPAVSESRVYIPGINGRMQSFPLRLIGDPLAEHGKSESTLTPEEREQLEIERRDSLRILDQYVEPLNAQSVGRIYQSPVISRDDIKDAAFNTVSSGVDHVVWVTDDGSMYLGSIGTSDMADNFEILYHVPTEKTITSRPTFIELDNDLPDQTGNVYMGSRDGYVYCIRENDGKQLWTYPCNEPIVEHLAVVCRQLEKRDAKKRKQYERHLYVPTYQKGMFCLDAVKGEKIWQTPGIVRFLSRTNSRLYTVDSRNNLTVMDVQSGQVLGTMPLNNNKIQYLNEITDRIYLATEDGMIQCLAQIDQEKPIYFRQDPTVKEDADFDPAANEHHAADKKKADEDEEEPGFNGDDDGGDFGDDAGNDFGDDDDAFGDDGAKDDDGFGDDAFGDDAGGNDAGADDGFGDDAGADDAGADDAGADDAGADDGGAADAEDDPFL
ncbi:MAG: PQQ-binding-like beta-propeller repeat protein [Thermoguttaceae bacterium]|nr:PQQ-binding-like beta-propeller repeat protein [Thermoguttaceae bacterium]